MADDEAPGIDASRAPTGERAARALVDAVAATDDRVERHFLEVKSDIDLTSKLGLAKVSKFILGAANRMPGKAAQHFEGHAVLVIGVGAGKTPGIPPVEAKDLEEGVRPYLTAKGPLWDIVRVPVSVDREVLLVLVAPPPSGQDAYLCHRDFHPEGANRKHSLEDGATYVRVEGATRRARADEIEQLRERGRTSTPAVDLSVTIDGAACSPSSEVSASEYVTAESHNLLEPIGAGAAERTRNSASLDATVLGIETPERRTVDGYKAEIAEWVERAQAALPTAIAVAAASSAPPSTIRVSNRSDAFLEDVKVVVHLAGEVTAHEPVEIDSLYESPMPPQPRKWGPMRTSVFGPYPAAVGWLSPPNLQVGPVTIENGGSTRIVFDIGDLRPREEAAFTDEVVLVSQDPEINTLTGTWSATARGHHRVFEGTLSVPVQRRDVTDALIAVLSIT